MCLCYGVEVSHQYFLKQSIYGVTWFFVCWPIQWRATRSLLQCMYILVELNYVIQCTVVQYNCTEAWVWRMSAKSQMLWRQLKLGCTSGITMTLVLIHVLLELFILLTLVLVIDFVRFTLPCLRLMREFFPWIFLMEVTSRTDTKLPTRRFPWYPDTLSPCRIA